MTTLRRLGGMSAIALVGAIAVQAVSSGTSDGQWRTYSADNAATKYSPLDQINRANVAADVHPAAVWQPPVEDGDVGSECRDPAGRLDGGAGLADDADAVVGLEQLMEPTAHDLMIVEQVDANRFLLRCVAHHMFLSSS